jgi:hypothetical protein
MGQPVIERAGARVYFLGDTYPLKDRIKSLGGHWDGDRRAWWVGARKLAEAEALVAGAEGFATPASAAAARSLGLSGDTPAGIVCDRLREEGRDREAEAVARPKQRPDDVRLTGKGRYKGRDYYLGSSTRDGSRVRLLTLPDAGGDYLDFWADTAAVEVTRRYQPREYRGRTESTTLGSIARFLARQANPATRRGECTECGAWGPSGEPCSECGGEGSYS